MNKFQIVWECDNCGGTDIPETDIDKRSPMPEGWVQIDIRSNHGMYFDGQICNACESAVQKALSSRVKEQ